MPLHPPKGLPIESEEPSRKLADERPDIPRPHASLSIQIPLVVIEWNGDFEMWDWRISIFVANWNWPTKVTTYLIGFWKTGAKYNDEGTYVVTETCVVCLMLWWANFPPDQIDWPHAPGTQLLRYLCVIYTIHIRCSIVWGTSVPYV